MAYKDLRDDITLLNGVIVSIAVMHMLFGLAHENMTKALLHKVVYAELSTFSTTMVIIYTLKTSLTKYHASVNFRKYFVVQKISDQPSEPYCG
jgi:hypothetical protein